MKKKLLYINNFEAPYRVPFFNLLGEYYDMTMAFSQKPSDRTERNLKWFKEPERTYKVLYLNTIKIGNIKIAFSIRKLLKDYDLIFMDMYGNPTNMYAIYCMQRMKIPFFMSVDGMLPKKESFFTHRIKSYFLNAPLKIMSPAKSVDACLKKYGVQEEKITRYNFTSLLESDILNSVPSKTEKTEIREKLGLAVNKKIIITVGRFTYNKGYGKGYDVLFKAMSRLPKDYFLYVIGDEPTKEFVSMKRNLGLNNVHFVNFVNKDELKEYYRAADLFCLQTRGDVWGLVINEAMGMGLPVITTKTCVAGGELVQNGINGYIADAEDDIKLEANIKRILSDDKLRKHMGEKSLRRIKEWTIEKMVSQHIALFEESVL